MEKFIYPLEVVVVDDDPTITNQILKILASDKRFLARSFNNSSDALSHIIDVQANFVISDVMMPTLSGDDLLSRLKEMDWPVQTAIISSISNISVAYRCFTLGAEVFLKPVTKEIVCSIVTCFTERACRWNICVDKIMDQRFSDKNAEPDKTTAVRKKILIVDDDPDIREYSSDILSDEFDIIEAENGEKALSVYDFADIILLDMNMPGMDGFQFMSRISKDPYFKTPVIVISGFVKPDCKFEYPHVIGIINKPFESSKLTGLVDLALKKNSR